MSDIYTYDYDNKLLVSSDEIDPDMVEDLHKVYILVPIVAAIDFLLSYHQIFCRIYIE